MATMIELKAIDVRGNMLFYSLKLIFVSGVFSAAHDLKMEWVVVKGISGYADGTEEKENWQTFASVTAASLVVSILNQCSIFEDWPHYKGKQINSDLFQACSILAYSH